MIYLIANIPIPQNETLANGNKKYILLNSPIMPIILIIMTPDQNPTQNGQASRELNILSLVKYERGRFSSSEYINI